MTTPQTDMLLLKSEAGDFYVLPHELLERGGVPVEHTAEAERLFAAATADDVAGHLNFTKIEADRGFVGTTIGGGRAKGAMFSIAPFVHDRRDPA